MWSKLFNKRPAREKWDSSLVWFRLRYLEAKRPSLCLRLLSRPEAYGRVALYFQPDAPVSRLYLGVPESHLRLLQQMVADFGFSLKPKPPEVALPTAQRLIAVETLPWDRPFLAHIVNEIVFVSVVADNNSGSYFPQGSASRGAGRWCLPQDPPAGLTLAPARNGQAPPPHLVANDVGERRWLVGRSQSNLPLQVAGRVNVYGRQAAVAEWLVHQVTQMISRHPAQLVVIDGKGDLVPQLKRKAAVTRLLGAQLAYVDIDSASLVGGFNPLAAVPGETAAGQVQRWQHWFQGMAVHPQGIQLLAQAHQAGVGDIPALRKWLKQQERQGHYAAASSLDLALSRLTASRSLREWLEWPTSPFNILPQGSLFFACKGSGWDRQNLLRSVLLSALRVKGAFLIVHGFPWQKVAEASLSRQANILLSNGPLLAESTVVLTESQAQAVSTLAHRFLGGDVCLSENLELLNRGESLIVSGKEVLFTTWNDPKKGPAGRVFK
ncbi:MAG: hypothetical protein WAS33_22755 [Candidatus Promineifilaceae bacterium]